MTFALLRAGLPNSVVAIALAIVPIVAIALSPAPRSPHAPADVIAAAQSQALASGDQAVPN